MGVLLWEQSAFGRTHASERNVGQHSFDHTRMLTCVRSFIDDVIAVTGRRAAG